MIKESDLTVYCKLCTPTSTCGAEHRALLAWIRSTVTPVKEDPAERGRKRALARAAKWQEGRVSTDVTPPRPQAQVKRVLEHSAPLTTMQAKLREALLKAVKA